MKKVILIQITLFFLFVKVYSQNTVDSTEYLPDSNNRFVKMYLNKKLPDFELEDINGSLISSEKLRGKYLHINLWSVTCRPCIEEFPELNQLKEKYKNDNVVFIAIAPENKKRVLKVLSKHPVNYIVIAGAKDYFDKNKLGGYPKNLFVNPEGKIIHAKDGSHYLGKEVNGKIVMTPDNFRFYDFAMRKMLEK